MLPNILPATLTVPLTLKPGLKINQTCHHTWSRHVCLSSVAWTFLYIWQIVSLLDFTSVFCNMWFYVVCLLNIWFVLTACIVHVLPCMILPYFKLFILFSCFMLILHVVCFIVVLMANWTLGKGTTAKRLSFWLTLAHLQWCLTTNCSKHLQKVLGIAYRGKAVCYLDPSEPVQKLVDINARVDSTFSPTRHIRDSRRSSISMGSDVLLLLWAWPPGRVKQ